MPKKQKDLKRFIIRKYVFAKNAKQAIEKDRITEVDDCWIDDEWKKDNLDIVSDVIGFEIDD